MDIINKMLSDTFEIDIAATRYSLPINGKVKCGNRDRVTCNDGFSISIQASDHHYCKPRLAFKPDLFVMYEEVELGFPSAADDIIEEYAEDPDAPTGTVYPCVPVDVVVKLIEKHGGIKE